MAERLRRMTPREFSALRSAATQGPLEKLAYGGRWRANNAWAPTCRSRAVNALARRGYLELVPASGGHWTRARITPIGQAAFEACVACGANDADPTSRCAPGAWGSKTNCLTHEGFDLDSNGLCIEGRRGERT